MPSLFSRARTASTPSPSTAAKAKTKPPPQPPLILPPQALPASGVRRPALSLGVDEFGLAGEAGYGAVGFLPSSFPRDFHTPFAGSSSLAPSPAPGQPPQPPPPPPRQQYGLLSVARDTVLGLTDAARLTSAICAALERTGVATPFVFSSLALDARKAGVVRLVQTFLTRSPEAFEEETRFSGAHELALCLRWGLSRVVRVEGGRELRGLLSWAWYERWKGEEAANAYPPTAFTTFIDSLPAQLAPILRPLFDVCTKLVAHSSASGHTPPSLASILSPLLFGLSPPPLGTTPVAPSYPTPTSPTGKKDKKDKGGDKEKDDPEALLFPTIDDFSVFTSIYEEYLRGARAAEHLILACIREVVSSGGGALGGPTRLREWVGMYPASIDTGSGGNNGAQTRIGARRGAKTVRVVHVRRNVRSYSGDLVKSGSSWAESTGGTPNAWAASRAWRTIVAGGAGAPRYTDSYRKRMDFGVGVHPSTTSLSSSTSSSLPGLSPPTPYSSLTSPSSTSLASTESAPGAFRSLTDLQWGAFESLGFGHGTGDGVGGFEVGLGVGDKGEVGKGGIEGRLRFDLTENARAERAAKRETLSWADFSAAGFSRSDAPLSATLQFAPPLSLGLGTTTANTPLNAELTRKLRKAHKALPAFGWDTAPVLGAEEVLEEAFLDVFCDLLYGGGWMERAAGVGGPSAELARECSWALVEYKSRSGGQQDPGATLVLYEEFVPREYRLALAGVAPPGTRRRLPSFFTPSTVPGGGKAWKQAPTLNGRPYVLGATPAAMGSSRDLDFESMLRAQGNTKMISLGPGPRPPETPAVGISRTRSEDSSESGHGPGTPSKRQSGRFRLPGGMLPNPSPGGASGVPRTVVRPGMAPAESRPVEFATRFAAGPESDDSEEEADEVKREAKQRRRESASDAWVDILVGSMGARRMGGQDAVMRTTGSGARRRAGRGGPDLDLASMEVAQRLAAETMMNRTSVDVDMEPVPQPYRDSDVVEVERVPRKSEQGQSVESHYDDDNAYDGISEGEGYGAPTDDEEDSLTPGAEVHPVLAQARQARRAGYFDAHPERRPVSVNSVSDVDPDDPRSLLSGPDSDDEPEPLVPPPRNLDSIRPLPNPTPAPPPPPPAPIVSAPAPATSNASIAAPKPSQPSKTGALIDMFREKEMGQKNSPKPPPLPAPSRLPVRAAGTGVAAGQQPPASPIGPRPTPSKEKASPAAVPPPAPSPAPAPKPSPPLLDPSELQLPLEEGRASPARYVHGAPLHNVLEEEEEE
ncbi:F-box domain-containing protein [Mycena indigotica]|uniref:F-box domain-containing protein n=1 Tax=Mycena indigotica TaxID=2126181 RepID=A0A8H6VTK0_9AGAR|nr:F-box domain-containing protein [Mycena indigotica]KAF7291451.1 F-box domain-containing protein [Mycena indigotica]